MADEGQAFGISSHGELLTAEFKDGKLEIVEVSSYNKGNKQMELPGLTSDGSDLKYVQVLDTKDTVVDLLNFTLVRSLDGEDSYQLIANGEVDGGEHDGTVTCVLSNEEADAAQSQLSSGMTTCISVGNASGTPLVLQMCVDGSEHFPSDQGNQEYVMVEGIQGGDAGPLVLLQSPVQEPKVVNPTLKKYDVKASFKTPSSPTEILEKAKALQKAKILMRCTEPRTRAPPKPVKPRAVSAGGRRGRELPPTHELLASPNFKLFLYSCKMCRFKCNAIKELTAHKALEHAGGGGSGGGGGARWRGAGRAAAGTLQCARCPFRAATHTQLMKHVQDNHLEAVSTKVYLDSAEVEAADVLVCGACGFESGSREVFKKHIEEEHGATTC